MDVRLVIDNEAVEAGSGRMFERLNPVSGHVVTRAAASDVADAVRAAESAQFAFAPWSQAGPTERRRVMLRVANDTPYGLSSAVFGRDVTRALAVASRIDAGCVYINGPRTR